MSSLDNILGKRYSKLVVISQVESEYRKSPSTGKLSCRAQWLCRCDCGRELKCTGSRLRRGLTTQCQACAYASRPQSTRRMTVEERLFNLHIKGRAKRAGIKVSLTVEEYSTIIKNNCYYCGAAPRNYDVYRGKFSKKESVLVNGIDRLDSNVGYEAGNCVPCCPNCNMGKGTKSVDEFIEHVKNIIKFWEKKNG